MNKSFGKLTLTLFIIITVLLVLLLVVFTSFTAIWLKTYKAFTKERLVAEIRVTEQKNDFQGKFFDIEYKQLKEVSALSKFLSKNSEGVGYEASVNSKLYGDQFEVGGQVVKFSNWATLLGFDTIYKVTRMEGDFTNVNEANNSERKVIELNGGVDNTWKYLEENEDKMDFVVDTVYGSFATKFIQGEDKIYGLYITEDGFILDELKEINY